MELAGHSNDLVAKSAQWVREMIDQGARAKPKITYQFLYRSAKLCRFGIADVVVVAMVGRTRGVNPASPNHGKPTFHNMHPVRHIYWSVDNSGPIYRVPRGVLIPVKHKEWTPKQAEKAMDAYDGKSVTREVWGHVDTVLAYD